MVINKKSGKSIKIVIIGFAALCGITIWAHLFHLDGTFGYFFGILGDTLYAPGYSDIGFKNVKCGATREKVLGFIGYPIYKCWIYCDKEKGKEGSYDYRVVYIIAHVVTDVYQYNGGSGKDITICSTDYSEEKFDRIELGQPEYDVMKIMGEPLREYWIYSKSPQNTDYRIRQIFFKDGKVTSKRHELYID